MDPLRFGPAYAPDTRRVLPGVVAGIGGYGNCLGLPNIGGETVFDACYAGNPLVNALAVGALRHEDLKLAKASGPGNLVVLFGARTGGDGIGGVSVLASETFGDEGPAKRPSVQVGDPFTEKLLIECCVEIYAADLVVGIQDLGGAGLSCATSELASAGDGGMRVELDKVPLRDSSLSPEEILMSESQERMCAIVEPSKIDEFLAICAKWDVTACVIGEVTEGDRLEITWHGEQIVDVPPETVAHEGPVYERPLARPEWQDDLQADSAVRLPRPESYEALRELALRMVATPNLADKKWITEQYDHYVRGNTALAQPEDSGVLRVDEETGRGVAISTDGNGRFCKLDPYEGARLAVAEAYRNVATVGARPLAVSDCLNFGSPEEPAVMWQFQQAIAGIADACRELELPVTGGNVSFYNQTGDVAIHPTPVIGVLGTLEDVARRTPMGLRRDSEDVLLLVGAKTCLDLDGSEWAYAEHDHIGGRPPALDLAAERALAEAMERLASGGLVTSAHDVSDGGLWQAIAEACIRGEAGVEIDLTSTLTDEALDEVPMGAERLFVALFSETATRALVAVPADQLDEALAAIGDDVPVTRIGLVTGEDILIDDLRLPVADVATAWRGTFPAIFA